MEFYIKDYKITGIDSLNKIYSGGHYYERQNYSKGIHTLVRGQLKRQLPEHIHSRPVIITVSFPEDNLDIDNHSYFTKCVIDSLKGYLIVDDSRKYVKGVIQIFEPGLKNIRVRIEEV